MTCNEFRRWIPAYVDHELGVDRVVELEEHLGACRACARRFQMERWVAEAVRRHYAQEDCPDALEQKLESILRGKSMPRQFVTRTAAVFAALGMAALVWAVAQVRTAATPLPPKVAMADEAYEAFVQGRMHLAARSREVSTLDAWLADHLAFYPRGTLRSPAGLVPEGAGVVRVHEQDVGVVAYRSRTGPALLLIAAQEALPLGGESVRLGKSEFRTFTRNGRKLIAWNHGAVSYVLVSQGEQDGARACASCHAGVRSDRLADFGSGLGREL